MPQQFDVPTQYNIGTGYTQIPATKFARRVKMWEDGTSGGAGVTVRFTRPDGSQVVVTYDPADYPIILGDAVPNFAGAGAFLAMPAQDGSHPRAADNYCEVKAAAATVLNVLEEA